MIIKKSKKRYVFAKGERIHIAENKKLIKFERRKIKQNLKKIIKKGDY
ncbi:MAG: hypothetical protein ACYDDE_00580 [bacterium]